MQGPEDRAIAYLSAQKGQRGQDALPGDLPQDASSEVSRHVFHFLLHRGVLVGEIGMAASRVDDDRHVPASTEVRAYGPHPGMGKILKVDGHEPAQRAGGLVHEPAWLAEVFVFRKLGDERDLDAADPASVGEVVEDRRNEHLVRSRRAEARAFQDVTGHACAESSDRVTGVPRPGRHAPRESRRGAELRNLARQVVDADLMARVSFAFDCDAAIRGRRGDGDCIQIHRRGEHPAAIVIGVVAADLRTAGRAEKAGALHVWEGILESFKKPSIPGFLSISRSRPCPVQ